MIRHSLIAAKIPKKHSRTSSASATGRALSADLTLRCRQASDTADERGCRLGILLPTTAFRLSLPFTSSNQNYRMPAMPAMTSMMSGTLSSRQSENSSGGAAGRPSEYAAATVLSESRFAKFTNHCTAMSRHSSLTHCRSSVLLPHRRLSQQMLHSSRTLSYCHFSVLQIFKRQFSCRLSVSCSLAARSVGFGQYDSCGF